MLDPRLIETHPNLVASKLSARGLDGQKIVDDVIRMVTDRRAVVTAIDAANRERKEHARLFTSNRVSDDIIETGRALNREIAALELRLVEDPLDRFMLTIPNLSADEVPVGVDENDNVEILITGTKPEIENPLDHVDLAQAWDSPHPLMDFERATKVSGPRFVYLRGSLARLERAIGDFMLDRLTMGAGFEEVSPPTLVSYDAMVGTGQYPKFEDDAYKTEGLSLIPTSEVSLTNIVRDEVVPEAMLPIRMAAQTLCYRREAGSAGRDTKGMIRQHQFRKVEMVSICKPEDSKRLHGEMLGAAMQILGELGLPYRVVELCTGDLGFSAVRTFDIEVWLPSQNAYREISSISNCGDFQARRMKARFKRTAGGKPEFVHTLNGSGLAVGRTLVAIMENYQKPNGQITIPDVLQARMGATVISTSGTLC